MYQWSPKSREEYAIEINGTKTGVGAREVFDEFPGLWNLFWIHSFKADRLKSEADFQGYQYPEILIFCLEDMDVLCGARTLIDIAANDTPDQFVEQVLKYDCQFRAREHWDSGAPGWESLVRDKIKTHCTGRSLHHKPHAQVTAQHGNVIKVDFGLANNSQLC